MDECGTAPHISAASHRQVNSVATAAEITLAVGGRGRLGGCAVVAVCHVCCVDISVLAFVFILKHRMPVCGDRFAPARARPGSGDESRTRTDS